MIASSLDAIAQSTFREKWIEAHSEGIKVELYGTVFTIRQKPCWFGDEAPYTESLKLQVIGLDAFLVGRRVAMLRDAQPVRHKFKVPYDWARELRDRLRKIKVVAYPDFAVGCDGGYTEFFFHRWRLQIVL